jgi:hypothetical protein
MTDYLQRALQEINSTTGYDATEEDVMVHGPAADGREYTVVLDRGIKGSPKYRLPIKTLPKLEKPGPVQAIKEAFHKTKAAPSETESAWPESVLTDDADEELTGLRALSYRELQALAKEADVPANQTSEELIAALQKAEDAS